VNKANLELTEKLNLSNMEISILSDRWKECEVKKSDLQAELLDLIKAERKINADRFEIYEERLKEAERKINADRFEIYEERLKEAERKINEDRFEIYEGRIKVKALENDVNYLFQFTLTHYYALASEVLDHFIDFHGSEIEVARFNHATPEQITRIQNCVENRQMDVRTFQTRANQLVTYRHKLIHCSDISDLKSKIADALQVADKVKSRYPNDILLSFAFLVLESNDMLLPHN
jgi:hypothetical protein